MASVPLPQLDPAEEPRHVVHDLHVPRKRDVDLPGVSGNGAAPTPGRVRDYDLPLKEFLRRAEREYLTAVLRKNQGGISSTAEHAMIDAATLHRKMKTHSLRRDDFKERSLLRS